MVIDTDLASEGEMSATKPWVDAFALEMEEKLSENRHKGDREGWAAESPDWLLGRLRDEVGELSHVLLTPEPRCGCREIDCHHLGTKLEAADRRARIIRECADIANFAMMIADVAGGLRAIDGEGKP